MKLRLTAAVLACALLTVGCSGKQYDSAMSLKGESYGLYVKDSWLYVDFAGQSVPVGEEQVYGYRAFDMDGDECDEIVVLTLGDDCGSDVVLYEVRDCKVREVYRKDFSAVKPWKVEACDVDGDGWGEVFVGVYKDTRFYKEERRRPFFYTWDGKALRKKWEGSAFSSRTLIDVAFGDYFNMGKDLTAVLEMDDESKCYVSIYVNASFGFTKVTESEPMEDIVAVETLAGPNGDCVMAVSAKGRRILNVEFVRE